VGYRNREVCRQPGGVAPVYEEVVKEGVCGCDPLHLLASQLFGVSEGLLFAQTGRKVGPIDGVHPTAYGASAGVWPAQLQVGMR
jgi:hypothetical protein